MQKPKQPRRGTFSEFTALSAARKVVLCSGIAVTTFRPNNRRNDTFVRQEHWLPPVSAPTLFVERYQYTTMPGTDEPQWSVILHLLKFAYDVHSGLVYVDAKRNDVCNAAVYNCTLRGDHRERLDPVSNKTAADLAVAMFREANRVLDAGEPIPHQPTLPDFYLSFAQRPAFEKGPVVRREASATLGVAEDHIGDGELEEFFWSQCFEADGCLYVPQRYLARQGGDYPVHPADGSPRPDGYGKPGQWKGLWYFGDGRWTPAAQRPQRVYAHMGNVLGRSFRNPAFTVLKANSFFPADLTYPQFMAAPDVGSLHRVLTEAVDANGTVVELLTTAMRQAMGKNGDMATDDDLMAALEAPHLPMTLTFASGVRVVRYSGPPRPEAMTWQLPGVYVNLFDAKQVWASRVEPAVPRLAGSHDHGAPTQAVG